jgi:hypothetical protein
MINYIGCLTFFILGLLLSNFESIGIKEAKILTIIGWCISLYFLKGELSL